MPCMEIASRSCADTREATASQAAQEARIRDTAHPLYSQLDTPSRLSSCMSISLDAKRRRANKLRAEFLGRKSPRNFPRPIAVPTYSMSNGAKEPGPNQTTGCLPPSFHHCLADRAAHCLGVFSTNLPLAKIECLKATQWKISSSR